MKNMQTKVLEIIEKYIEVYNTEGEKKCDFIVNLLSEKSGTAYIMEDYYVKLSMYFEFYTDYFNLILFPENIRPDIQSFNAKLHLSQFIVEYHQGRQIKNLLESLEENINNIITQKPDLLNDENNSPN